MSPKLDLEHLRAQANRPSILQRFWARVVMIPFHECWEWTGPRNGQYGQLSYENGNIRAHRAAYELFVGPIPDGLSLDHLCRNTMCVNPSHLEPVTHRENVLRGISVIADNARKTHCPLGHELTFGCDGRTCYICKKQRALFYKRRLRASQRAARLALAVTLYFRLALAAAPETGEPKHG